MFNPGTDRHRAEAQAASWLSVSCVPKALRTV
jgi:hypothetical protein